jgi:hypothetical protein
MMILDMQSPPMNTCAIRRVRTHVLQSIVGRAWNMPACMGIVGQIASVTSLKALTAKPDAVNGSDLTGKVAVSSAEPELPSDAYRFSRLSSCSMHE